MKNIKSYEKILSEQQDHLILRTLKAHKDPNDTLFGAAVYGNVQACIYALEMGAEPSFIAPLSGNSAIGEAAKNGYTEIVKILLDNGVNPDLVHEEIGYKMTPLILACDAGQADTAKVLLDAGADPNAKDLVNRNALSFVLYALARPIKNTKEEYYDILTLLMDSGADPTLPITQYSWSSSNCIDLAERNNDVKALEIMLTRSIKALRKFQDEKHLIKYFDSMDHEVPIAVLNKWRKLTRGKNMFGV